jgi:hypothetical protein
VPVADEKLDSQELEERADPVEDEDEGNPDDPLADREDLQEQLYSLFIACRGEDRFARLVEVKDVKRAEFYWTGRQYIWWSSQDRQYQLPQNSQAFNYGDLNVDDMPRFEFVTNIYQATGLTVIGAISGAPPRYRFFPTDADEANDLDTAAARTKEAKLIERWNPPQKLLQEEAYHAYTGGFICYWTRYVTDGEKYGVDPAGPEMREGSYQPQSTIVCQNCGWSAPAEHAMPPVPCPECGEELTEDNIAEENPIPVPEADEGQEKEKGREIISIYGALNCPRPQYAQEQSQFHYFAIEEEMHYSVLQGAFPDKAEKITEGADFGAEDVYERNARLSVLENTALVTQTGAAQAKLVTFARVWFRPSAFNMIKDPALKDELKELFPRGCRVEFAGHTYCTSVSESMDDAIVTAQVMPGRGQHRNGAGTSMLSIQDRFNTRTNITEETYEYGIPVTYRASDTFDESSSNDQRAAPGLEVPVELRQGEDLRSKILQVRADSIPADMAAGNTELMGPVTQYISGTYPALTGAGAGQGAPETLGQQSMQRDQAMGRIGVFYVNLKQAKADIMTLACRDLERNTEGKLKMPVFGQSGDFESETVDVTALEGDAEAYPEGDEQFPELWNQQRATMTQVMDTPWGGALVQDPENADLFARLLGIPGLKVPGVDSRRKQLREINELLQIPGGDQALAGVAPMVEIDQENDDHAVEAETCKNWINSEAGQRAKRENPNGFEAVRAHRRLHMQALPKPEPPTKPLAESMTVAFKDMPPEAQRQVLAKFGVNVSPEDFLAALAMKQAEKTPPAPGTPPQVRPPIGGPANAAVSGP